MHLLTHGSTRLCRSRRQKERKSVIYKEKERIEVLKRELDRDKVGREAKECTEKAKKRKP